MNETISVSLQDIQDAQQRIKGKVNRTPLVRFYDNDLPAEEQHGKSNEWLEYPVQRKNFVNIQNHNSTHP